VPVNPLDLADLHLDLLYEREAGGLLLVSGDAAVGAPLFHLARTTEGNRWLLSAALPEQQRTALQQALASEPVVPDLGEMESRAPVLMGARALLGLEKGSVKEYRGPAFLFPDELPQVTEDVEVLRDVSSARTVAELAWIREATPAELPIAAVCNAAGLVVAVCHSARSTRDAAEAGVETAPAYRGRGLAGAVVAGWAAAVRSEGRLAFYGTEWSNDASRAVARKLGLIVFSEDFHVG
jgi:RimJ/RimL family protein N-acetyltransferase